MEDIKEENIPSELKQRKRWLGMKLIYDKDLGKPSKIPINCNTGDMGSSTSEATWSSFSDAIAAVWCYKLDGIGFALGDGILGIDIDHCVVEGKTYPEVQEIIDLLDSYTEYSYSGTGIHILSLGEKPEDIIACKKKNFNGKGSDLEIYDKGRYFVVTGKIYGKG